MRTPRPRRDEVERIKSMRGYSETEDDVGEATEEQKVAEWKDKVRQEIAGGAATQKQQEVQQTVQQFQSAEED